MRYYFTSEAVVPVRSHASESSEMVTQLLFGEKGEILNTQDSWYRIRSEEDGYEGWIDQKMVLLIDQEKVDMLSHFHFVLQGSLLLEDRTEIRLPLGARIPVQHSLEVPISFQVAKTTWNVQNDLNTLPVQDPSQRIALSRYFLNTPYLWGGRSSWGIDCSGFVQILFRMSGIQIPRDAYQQAELGEEISFGTHQPGDLAFFRKANQKRISHVGMIVSNETIIHTSGKVRLDFLGENGIIRGQENQLTHNLVFIKRIQPGACS